MNTMQRRPMPAFRTAVALVAAALAAACSPASIVEVETPDVITPGAVATLAGIAPLRTGVIAEYTGAFQTAGDGIQMATGLMADEYFRADTFTGRIELDTRNLTPTNDRLVPLHRAIHRTRRLSEYTAAQIRRLVSNPNTDFRYAEMYTVAGQAYSWLAENFCSPQPVAVTQDDGSTLSPIPNLSRVEINTLALAKYDSALAAATAFPTAGAARDRLLNLARLGRGRALLELNRPADAAAAVALVPSSFVEASTHSNLLTNGIWGLNASGRRNSVSDREAATPAELTAGGIPDGVGLDYRSANDPRVTWVRSRSGSFDGVAPLFINGRNASPTSSAPILYGVEARLIEAEAQLRAGNEAGYISALNAIRTNATLYPARPADDLVNYVAAFNPAPGTVLPALTAPTPGVVDRADVRLLFRERAFWLFGTGRRLADLRRQLRDFAGAPFGLTEANTFPGGGRRAFFSDAGGVSGAVTRIARSGPDAYGAAVAFEIGQPEDNNPNFDRAACSTTTP